MDQLALSFFYVLHAAGGWFCVRFKFCILLKRSIIFFFMNNIRRSLQVYHNAPASRADKPKQVGNSCTAAIF